MGPRYSDELNWRDQAKHTFGSPVQWEATDDLESDAGAAALETALGMKPSHTIADVSGPSTWRDDVAINVASDYPPGDTSDEAGGYEGSGPDYSGGVTTGTSFDADTDPADEGTRASYAGDVTQVGPGRQDADTMSGGSDSGGGGKIVCTMMNETYGFGNFRNKIWLRQSKNLAPEYQKGYHKIFLPLVRLSKTNMVIRKILEHIAVHRTIDIRQEARGKRHLLGRIYRKILEPICYWVGKDV